MIINDKPITFDRMIRIALTVMIGWAVIRLIAYLSDVLIPFAVALLLAYLINPLVSWIQIKLRIRRRILSVFLSLGAISITLSLLGALLLPLIFAEMSHMRRMLINVMNRPDFRQQFISRPQEVWRYIKELISGEELIELLNYQNVKEIAQQILPGIWGFFSGTLSFFIAIFGLVIILLYLIFILLDYDQVSKGWKDLIPEKYREIVLDIIDDFTEAMSKYFRAQAFIAFLVGILHAFGFWLIGLPMGIVLGLFIGVLNMVPYLQVVGFIPAILFAVLSSLDTGGSAWAMVGLVMLVFAVVQIIQDTLLVPRIMGKVTGFNPAMILLSLSIWGKLLGILGLIIALPITFLIHSYYKRYLALSITRPPAVSEDNQGQ